MKTIEPVDRAPDGAYERIMRTAPLCIGLLLVLSACVSQEEQVRRQIDEANHCKTADDCVLVGSTCPFGCYIYAHADEAEHIRTVIDDYESTCVYSCIQSSGVECLQGKCMAVTDMPQNADEISE